jgi:dihydroorotate dehydrogenase (NAD+) catalytic subunit
MKLNFKIRGVTFKNPIWSASGTFGYGREFQPFFDLNQLGAIVTKTVTLHSRCGNSPPRIVETASGLLNAIGLENNGAKSFVKNAYPFLKSLKTQVVVSVAANNPEELVECVKILDQPSFPAAFEINLSCPNIDHQQGKTCLISQDKDLIKGFIANVKRHTDKLIIAKLTPNVTDIAQMAVAAQEAKADAVSMVNTFVGLAVNAHTMQPMLGNVTGGLSGPAIKPLALNAVWKTFKQISIPIIGMGGIMTGIDVAEFMICGATAVQIGTANFISPDRMMTILKEFQQYLKDKQLISPQHLIGKLKNN